MKYVLDEQVIREGGYPDYKHLIPLVKMFFRSCYGQTMWQELLGEGMQVTPLGIDFSRVFENRFKK